MSLGRTSVDFAPNHRTPTSESSVAARRPVAGLEAAGAKTRHLPRRDRRRMKRATSCLSVDPSGRQVGKNVCVCVHLIEIEMGTVSHKSVSNGEVCFLSSPL